MLGPFKYVFSRASRSITQPTEAIYEAALAKQYRRQPLLGTYAMSQYVPFLPLAHHARATSDVLTYASVTDQTELQQQLYPAAYGRLGSAAVAETLSVSPLAAGAPFYTAPLMRMTGAVAGTTTGQAMAKRKVNGSDNNSITINSDQPLEGKR